MALVGTVVKLSSRGWTTHKRTLALSNDAITYYKEPNLTNTKDAHVKASVPLSAVLTVQELVVEGTNDNKV
jgi:hypothetical protein